MAKDRSLDRHTNPSHAVRLDPPELWDRLGDTVGKRNRTATISDLIRRYLDGEPMPERPHVS